MLTALHPLAKALPSHIHILDHILSRATRRLQGEFIYWVDGGCGVGLTSRRFGSIQAAELFEPHHARVFCYDPLPENYNEMAKALGRESQYVLRNVALSNSIGDAQFVIPYRVEDAGAGNWAKGTSWGGSLKLESREYETVTVKKIRLQDEPIPRFDFVKLDLQGGELDALDGMGDRLIETKLLYVEAQLLSHADDTVSHIQDRGFIVFYDRLQFGFRAALNFVPLEVLKSCGIVIDRIMVPQRSGMQMTCWGHFDNDSALDPITNMLRADHSKRLEDAGVSYLQTDAIGINVKNWRSFASLLTA